MAAKKKTVKPDAELAALKRANAKLARQLGERTAELGTARDRQAAIAVENARLFNENREALERQTATAEILKIIASSPDDVQPVFEAIASSANRLIGGLSTAVYSLIDDMQHLSALTPINPAADAALRALFPRPLSMQPWPEQTRNGEIVHVPDIEADPAVPKKWLDVWRMRGFRGFVRVPLRRDRVTVGMITVTRAEPGPFAAHHIQLLQTFADQAVIAIENARLFNETREALERQTATADILKVIASSPSDVGPVFDAIAASSNRLIGGFSTAVLRFSGDTLHLAAFTPTNAAADEALQAAFPRPLAEFPAFMLVRDGKSVQYDDTDAEDVPAMNRDMARLRGYRSMLFTPLMNDRTPIGLISVTRAEPGPFAPHHVQLVQAFADQAVIAIENVRLFEEVQAKTRDLTEALTYQTGSSNILKVIASSPTDIEPVLKAIVESACELCDADDAVVHLRDGTDLRHRAHHGPIPFRFEKMPISRDWVTGRAFVDKLPIHLHDVASAEGAKFPEAQRLSRLQGTRTILSVPLMREGESMGAMALRRTEVKPFSDKQIALLQTFSDQAVIAIGNVRLFDEVQARTRDLSESLQFQTATSEVLKVISRSPDSLQPVLDVIVETSRELCGSDGATIFLLRDGKFHFTAVSGTVPKHLQSLQAAPREIGNPGSVFTRVFRQKRTLHYSNIADDPELLQGTTGLGGPRALLLVPLMRDNEVIGTIVLRQSHLRPFTPRQIQVIEVFADQAVIAISNVGLFEQVQQRTRELSASLDDLRTAQDRLVQTEKLASLGQLTAGIAHEIKNPLNFVNNFSALSAELVDELSDALRPVGLEGKTRQEVDDLTQLLKDNLQKVVQHGKRADSIVKNMLLHSREGSGEHRPTDINALLDESLNLAYHGARAEKSEFNITLQRDFDEKAGMIELFPQEITRAFLNLISNGFYAAAKRKTETGNPGFEPALRATTRNMGNSVEIRIRDNGTGIPAEVKEKMFNPFFTTKPAGEGTGLGLSMSHDIIVKQHSGTIDVATEPGQYTEFTILLPRSSVPQENKQDKKRGEN